MTVGQSIPHDSAREHVRGTATYIADMPPLHGELVVDIVGSPVAHGRIKSIDVAAAKKIGAIVLTAADVPGQLEFGPNCHDEELLAKGVVQYVGQPVVAVAGDSVQIVAAAKALVRIEIEPQPAVLSIDEAIERKQFIGQTRRIRRGKPKMALAAAEHRLSGELRIGGQEHFYLEAQAALAIPGEAGEMSIHSSTQNPSEIQAVVAACLGLPYSKVVCICKRMGGGFGGKETQGALPAVLAALVAAKTGRPARMIFGHEQDFRITGKRHAYRARYDVGFTSDGVITALESDFHSDGGCSADLSLAVMERTLLHGENAYFIPNVELTGTVCRTNRPSNTAFRGFGGPQAVAAMENVIEEIANHLGIDAFEIRRRNCYRSEPECVTPYGQTVNNNTLPELLDRLVGTSDYHSRRAAVIEFNARSRAHRRGIALTPVKFGICFTRRTLNQANALVNVLLDGTVQVSSGGTEMGQGLNTKLAQLVADVFGIPVTYVRVMPTSTEKNHNTSPTAASASTDLNGAAAIQAATAIRERIVELVGERFGREPFRELVAEAYEQRVDLGARGFHATPGVDFDRATGQGTPFLYFTNGAAVSEVQIDRFTGEYRVERVDLLMDLGRMINPAIDRGQVIGGFVQGMGWVTTEALAYSEEGALLSDSATTYKIPNVTDVPADFRVEFLDNPHNTANIHCSKAVGEPPLLLAVSVWAAIKQALGTALDLPATNEEVLRRLTEMQQSKANESLNGAAPVRDASKKREPASESPRS